MEMDEHPFYNFHRGCTGVPQVHQKKVRKTKGTQVNNLSEVSIDYGAQGIKFRIKEDIKTFMEADKTCR